MGSRQQQAADERTRLVGNGSGQQYSEHSSRAAIRNAYEIEDPRLSRCVVLRCLMLDGRMASDACAVVLVCSILHDQRAAGADTVNVEEAHQQGTGSLLQLKRSDGEMSGF
jgi:hypothetical protein